MENVQQINLAQAAQMTIGTEQQNLSFTLPNSSEIGHLWTSYQAETMSVCMLKQYVHETIEPQIRLLLQRALDISSQRVLTMETIFNNINHPIPAAFGEEDVKVSSENLFNDYFKLAYTRLMHKLIIINYCQAFTTSYRSDFRNYFKECIDTSQEIIQSTTNVLMAKGALIHSPYIGIPKTIDFVHDKNYAGTLLGDTRPINAIELSHVISLLEIKMLMRLKVIALSEIVRADTIRNHFKRFIHIADKQIAKLESFLDDQHLPKPSAIDYEVTDSKESPFSDRLMMSHTMATTAYIIAGYGIAIPDSPNLKLVSTYHRFITELLDLAKDASKLMIENNWLERIPETVDRETLLH